MKKIALLLAMLLCLAPVLSACGANSSAKKAAAAAFEAYYVDGDADEYFAVNLNYNVDLIKEFIDSEKGDLMRDAIREAQGGVKTEIKEYWDKYTKSKDDGGKGAEDLKVDYDIVFADTYGKKTEAFEKYIDKFAYKNTDIVDEVSKVARVGILRTLTYTDSDGDDYTEATVITYICYCIDGDWYVS